VIIANDAVAVMLCIVAVHTEAKTTTSTIITIDGVVVIAVSCIIVIVISTEQSQPVEQ
jgi:hypothetical protein